MALRILVILTILLQIHICLGIKLFKSKVKFTDVNPKLTGARVLPKGNVSIVDFTVCIRFNMKTFKAEQNKVFRIAEYVEDLSVSSIN